MFDSKMVSRTLVAVTLAITLGTGGRALAIDSFFDVFTEVSLGGTFEFSLVDPPIQFEDGGGTGGTIDTEILSMQLSSNRPATVSGDLGGGTFQIDSFFDVTYRTTSPVTGDVDHTVPDFLEMTTEYRPEVNPNPPNPANTQTWDTEIIAMTLTGIQNSTIILNAAPVAPGHVTILKISDDGGGSYSIDSFFDVFVELSVSGGPFRPQVGPPTGVRYQESGLPLPEPSTMILAMMGLLGLAFGRTRRRRR